MFGGVALFRVVVDMLRVLRTLLVWSCLERLCNLRILILQGLLLLLISLGLTLAVVREILSVAPDRVL